MQEYCVNVLRHGGQQRGETAFSNRLQTWLGLVCSPQEPQQRLRATTPPKQLKMQWSKKDLLQLFFKLPP